MGAELANDKWQFQFVTEWGGTTLRYNNLASEVPLKVENGNLPVGTTVVGYRQTRDFQHITSTNVPNPAPAGTFTDVARLSVTGGQPPYPEVGNLILVTSPSSVGSKRYDIGLVSDNEDGTWALAGVAHDGGTAPTGTITGLLHITDAQGGVVGQVDLTFSHSGDIPASAAAFIDVSLESLGNRWVQDAIIRGPYLKLSLGEPSDFSVESDDTNPDFIYSGNIKIFRKTRSFSRDESDASSTPPKATEILSEKLYSDGENTGKYSLVVLDHDLTPGVTYYYTIFFGNVVSGSLKWSFSPSNSHAKNFSLTNETVDSAPFSFHGDFLFNSLPRQWKIYDYAFAKNATHNLVNVFGRMFDALKEESFLHKKYAYDLDNVDARFLPYIDWLLAWPTNFELSSERRREETRQAATLWKSKGTIAALELALQTVTKWNVTVYQGNEYIVRTAIKAPYNSTLPPGTSGSPTNDGGAAWVNAHTPPISSADNPVTITTSHPTQSAGNLVLIACETAHGIPDPATDGPQAVEISGNTGTSPDVNGIHLVHSLFSTTGFYIDAGWPATQTNGTDGSFIRVGDGIWGDLTAPTSILSPVALNQTFDSTDPTQGSSKGTILDTLCYTPSYEVLAPTSIGWKWQNLNGVLIVLDEVPGVSGGLSDTIVRKINRISPLFALHYAAFSLLARTLHSETYDLTLSDDFSTDITQFDLDPNVVDLIEGVLDTTPDRCSAYTWDGSPFSNIEIVTNNILYAMFHDWLTYTCGALIEELDLMPQFITIGIDEEVNSAIPVASFGTFTFNPADYSGTRVFKLLANVVLAGTEPTLGVSLKLFNVTDNEEVDGSELTTSTKGASQFLVAGLTVGSAAGNLKNSQKTYMVKMELDNAATFADFSKSGVTSIVVT